MKKIVLGLGGASGAIYARRLLEKLQSLQDQLDTCGIIASDNARTNWQLEEPDVSLSGFGYQVYGKKNFNAPFASGSAKYDTMIICPCSMGLLGRVANGISSDLMSRTADVMLKERRKLILVLRETPYNLIHIENMRKVTLAGGIVCPATPSFYSQPATVEEVVDTVVDRVLDLAGFDIRSYRWGA